MTAESPSLLKVRSSAELIAAVPYLLGFHPADSLVIVGVRGKRVIFAGRYDLPPADALDEFTAHLVSVVVRQGVTATTLIGYGARADVTPVLLKAVAAVGLVAIPVMDALRVTDGQFWSSFCDDPHCCPKPCPPSDSPVAAAATFAGQVALPDREALVAQIAPVAGAERAAMTAATARAQARLTDVFGPDQDDDGFARALRRAGRRAVREAERRYRSGRPLTDDEVAWLGVTLLEVKVRDYAIDRLGDEPWQIQFWTDLVRRVEPGYVPAPATVLTWAAWRSGFGTLARVAVDRALAHDPEYRLAQYLDQLLDLGVSPAMIRDWPRMDREEFDPAPTGDEDAPRGDDQDAPAGDDEDAPAGDDQDAPAGDDEDAPPVEDRHVRRRRTDDEHDRRAGVDPGPVPVGAARDAGRCDGPVVQSTRGADPEPHPGAGVGRPSGDGADPASAGRPGAPPRGRATRRGTHRRPGRRAV